MDGEAEAGVERKMNFRRRFIGSEQLTPSSLEENRDPLTRKNHAFRDYRERNA
jgi:hypothetical protein